MQKTPARPRAAKLRLCEDSDGGIGQEVVGGRVLYHERSRDALMRHVEADLCAMALPRIPLSPQPFTVDAFLPVPGVTPCHDSAPARRLARLRRRRHGRLAGPSRTPL